MRRYLPLALAALVAFGDCLRGSFHFDDYAMLSGPLITGATRPITQLTFRFNQLLGGNDPWGYHLVNLLLHLAVVLLLFNMLQASAGEEAAFLAAGIFAVHPIQSEAVAYVFARGTLLSALFCLLCWRCWWSGKQWLAVGWFAVALLCKEDCVTFPLFLLLIGPRLWKPAAIMLGLACATGLRTLLATQSPGSGAGFTAGITPFHYLAAQGVVLLRYFRLLVLPWGFSIDPDIRPGLSEEALAWAAIIALFIAFRKRVWLWGTMILLIPSSSIFPAADLAADRRMYLPMLALVRLMPPIQGLWQGIALVGLASLSIGRMEVWKSESSIWAEAVEAAPGKARPRIQLARAVPPLQGLAVLSGAPDTAGVITERGRVYLDLGRPTDALREFGRALAMEPGSARAVNNRGAALLALGQREAARDDFKRALAIDPTLQDAKNNLATAAEK